MSILEKIQNLDEAAKRRLMFVVTPVIMAVVIFTWLAYFNNIVANSMYAAAENPQDGSGFTFLQTMKNGAAVVYESFAGKLRGFGDVLSSPREYIVQPPK